MYQQLFNFWFSQNYESLKEQLCCGGVLGELLDPNCEDCFHNSYICVYNSLKDYDGETDFNILFRAAYRRQRKAYIIKEEKEIRPNDLFWAFLTEEEMDNDLENQRLIIEERAKAVKTFAKKHFNKEQQEIFKMYFVCSFGCDQIASYIGKSVPTVAKCVKWCKDCLGCEFIDFCFFHQTNN